MDLLNSLLLLQNNFTFSAQDVQWDFIHGLYEQAIYGGRVDNIYDLNVMVSYLSQFFDPSNLSQGAKNKRLGPMRLPSSTNYRVGALLMLQCVKYKIARVNE